MKKSIENWKKAKKYVYNLGYELGQYSFKKRKNVILKNVNSIDGCKKIIGYIDVNNLEVELNNSH